MKGFTLVETIIYIGLFSLMFTGIITSVYPLLTNAERLTRTITLENEVMFVVSKIKYAVSQGITSSSTIISEPPEGASGSTLAIRNETDELFHIEVDETNTFCTPPRVCSMITYSESGSEPLPLNAERVLMSDFTVTHHAPEAGAPRFIEVKFTANGIPVGPFTYYLHF
jgi:type II secretory pathway pseudopilin PulG